MPTPQIHRQKIFAGNWKMHLSPGEAVAYFNDMTIALDHKKPQPWARRVIFPVSYCLQPHVFEAAAHCHVELGAQNIHWEEKGAFTGELSGLGLRDIGARWCLIGHSERRTYFNETDQTAAQRLHKAIALGFNIIYCLGERLDEREAGKTEQVLAQQIKAFAAATASGITGTVNDAAHTSLQTIALAYEPVWAIGTGKTATTAQAEEAHRFLRDELGRLGQPGLAATLPILYGGSVTPENAHALLSQPNIDGVLVGGASLKVDGFSKIITALD